ncbi:MAG: hypothetical protein FJY74_05745 [Candidatus Eisenbacteria bacterium]|nr:hypothetical protein [Candidatus Eisenbacteria bacterium]
MFRRKKTPLREGKPKSGLFLVKNGVRREVSFEELALSNTLSLEALVRVLTRRGGIDAKELLEEMDKVKTERFREGLPPVDEEVTH